MSLTDLVDPEVVELIEYLMMEPDAIGVGDHEYGECLWCGEEEDRHFDRKHPSERRWPHKDHCAFLRARSFCHNQALIRQEHERMEQVLRSVFG